MSRRTKRIAELIRHEMGGIIVADLNDPRVGFVTVTYVEISPDLRSARIFVSILGEDTEQRTTLRGLNSARKRIRVALGERIDLRRVPEISFHTDPGVKHSLKISNLLSNLAQERDEMTEAAEAEESDDRSLTEELDNNGTCA